MSRAGALRRSLATARLAGLAAALGLLGLGAIPITQTPAAAMRTRLAVFTDVWQAVADHYFDPTFGGVDWAAARDRYRPQVAAAPSDAAAYDVVSRMLGELGASRLFMIPPGQFAAPAFDEGPGGVGIDVRVPPDRGDRALVTGVERNSPADRAGLKPGAWVTAVNGVLVTDLTARGAAHTRTPAQARAGAARAIRGATLGAIGTSIALSTIDAANRPVTLTLVRVARRGDLETARLEGGISYVRAARVTTAVTSRLQTAVLGARATLGLILDLRGNGASERTAMLAVAEVLLAQPATISTLVSRTGRDPDRVSPARDSYPGPLVVMVDGLTAGAAEDLAAALRALRHGSIVVGSRTSGDDLILTTVVTPSGARVICPTARPVTPNDGPLDAIGLVPDVLVETTREGLLTGRDVPLDAAIRAIRSIRSLNPATPSPSPHVTRPR